MRGLWRRKVRIGRSRGQSEVIGTVFFVIITFLLSTNIFLWTIQKHDNYNQGVLQSDQMHTDRSSEKLTIVEGNYTLAPSQVTINITLFNEGPVPAKVLTLWVLDVSYNPYLLNHTSMTSPNNLDPGDTLQVNKAIQLLGCQSGDEFAIWFVTARGNTVPFLTEHFLTVVQMVQAIGPISVVFNSIRWTSLDHPAGGTYRVPKGEDTVTWKIDVTNYGTADITMVTGSSFTLFGASGGQTGTWELGGNTIVPVGRTVTLTFSIEISPVPSGTIVYPVIVTLIGYYGSDPNAHFGECIPYEAVRVVNGYP